MVTFTRKASEEMKERLKNILDEVEEVVEKEIIELILKSELAKQELNINSLYTKDENYSSRLKENILKRWISLKKWFVVGEGKSSEYENLLKITDEIIEKIVQNAYYMTQRKNVRRLPLLPLTSLILTDSHLSFPHTNHSLPFHESPSNPYHLPHLLSSD